MSVLILNPGSATIKWSIYDAIDSLSPRNAGSSPVDEIESVLASDQLSAGTIVVRYVHGGSEYKRPTRVTRRVLEDLEDAVDFAPLHNPNSIRCIRAGLEREETSSVIAVFDTEFFDALPRPAQLYGLPRWIADKYGIRRHGFHGFAHASLQSLWEARFGNAGRLITAQLGGGCSMTAIRNGLPVDTTMGFSPNEGLLMSTRSGDIDASLVTWLQRKEGWSPSAIDQVLNEQSGWAGMSQSSRNFGELLASQQEGAREAIALFSHRFRKMIGAFFAVLGGLDGIAFGGGVSEHNAAFCQTLLGGLEHLGIELNADFKVALEDPLTSGTSPVTAMIFETNEDRSILDSIRRAPNF